MNRNRLLENKVAVIYGAGGPIGGAVASAFARQGARLFLAGRTQAKLDQVARQIRSNGSVAETDIVDALDALESLRRQWAVELGPHGIHRSLCYSAAVLACLIPWAPSRLNWKQ